MACLHPFFLPDVHNFQGDKVPIPCGNCAFCKMQKVSILEQRAKWEYNHCKSSAFVTFTYDDYWLGHLTSGSSQPSLRRSDLKKYLDSIRHRIKNMEVLPKNCSKNFRYLACGEYGDSFS